MEAINLPDTEFKIMVLGMLKELSENYNGMKKVYKPQKIVINEEYTI